MTANGKWMILQGVGPVQVRVLDDGSVEVHERDEPKKNTETFCLTGLEAADDLRELISPERAMELRKSFATTCTSPLLDERERKRARIYSETFDSGTIDGQVDVLQVIYRHPDPGSAETSNQHRFEALVLGEIARVLGIQQSRLIAEIRAVARGDAIPDAIALPDRSAEIAAAGPPPPLIDVRAVGVLAVEDGLGFGPSGTEVTMDALPGVWFGYQDGEPDDPATVLIVHQDHVATYRDDRLHDSVNDPLYVEGGQMIAVDRTAADDPDMRRDLDGGGSGIHPNRCIRFGLGGDGVWTAATIDHDGVLVAVIARSRDRS